MNSFPFEFTFLNGPAINTFLDVQSVSREILSVADDNPFDVELSITNGLTGANLWQRLVFSGTPELTRTVLSGRAVVTTTNPDLQWAEVVVGLSGSAVQGETWTLTLNDGSGNVDFNYAVGPNNKALSKIGRELAAQIDADPRFEAEAFVDILFNSKIRIRSAATPSFKVSASIGTRGEAVVTGTPRGPPPRRRLGGILPRTFGYWIV